MPAGLLTQPTKRESDSLETRAKLGSKKRPKSPATSSCTPSTASTGPSAALCLCQKQKALERLNEAMREGGRQTLPGLVEKGSSQQCGRPRAPLNPRQLSRGHTPLGQHAPAYSTGVLEKKERRSLVENLPRAGAEGHRK